MTSQSADHITKNASDPASAAKGDLFGYGVAAKISGVEGRGTGEFALLVEGIARVRIDNITQERVRGTLYLSNGLQTLNSSRSVVHHIM